MPWITSRATVSSNVITVTTTTFQTVCTACTTSNAWVQGPSSVSNAPITTEAFASPSSPHLSTGAIGGIIVGSVLGFIFILLIGFCYLQVRRGSRRWPRPRSPSPDGRGPLRPTTYEPEKQTTETAGVPAILIPLSGRGGYTSVETTKTRGGETRHALVRHQDTNPLKALP